MGLGLLVNIKQRKRQSEPSSARIGNSAAGYRIPFQPLFSSFLSVGYVNFNFLKNHLYVVIRFYYFVVPL